GSSKTGIVSEIELEQELGVVIHRDTVRNCANEISFYGRTARKKPYVNRGSRFKRIKYARPMLKQPFGYCNNVLWSDESQFNLFDSDGKVMVWRTPKKEFNLKCTVAAVKYGGGNLKVIETLEWVPYSPDLNPMEHMRDELERRMKKHEPKNKDELRKALLQEWNGIGTDITEKLVDTVPNRLYECITMKGFSTRY
ncbi:unnamed protein product, partial [Didymodactylos carnosus]